MQFNRYAVYYVPPRSAEWTRWAVAWLGWDAEAGVFCDPPTVDAPLPKPIHEITRRPRKYGLHATLKPPMRLSEGADYAALAEAVSALSARLAPVTLDGLRVGRLGSFLALVPDRVPNRVPDLVPGREIGALNALAGACVTELDQFRAPAPESELARRRAAGLSASQERHLQDWGYPYVLDQFNFHITLSGRLTSDEMAPIGDVLDAQLAPLVPKPFVLGDIALAGEDAEGRFHVTERFPLTG